MRYRVEKGETNNKLRRCEETRRRWVIARQTGSLAGRLAAGEERGKAAAEQRTALRYGAKKASPREGDARRAKREDQAKQTKLIRGEVEQGPRKIEL